MNQSLEKQPVGQGEKLALSCHGKIADRDAAQRRFIYPDASPNIALRSIGILPRYVCSCLMILVRT